MFLSPLPYPDCAGLQIIVNSEFERKPLPSFVEFGLVSNSLEIQTNDPLDLGTYRIKM